MTELTSGIEVDLESYFARIGSVRHTVPTLATLQDLVLRHSERIPFENLNVLMGWPVRLDLHSLQDKLVRGGRGGYCFEQNLLLKGVLEALGYRVTGLAARVLWNLPVETLNARQHMLLRVDIDSKPYIVDVGFGALTPTGVLRLEAGVEQATPHESFRFTRIGDDFLLEAQTGDFWKTLYRFDLYPQLLPDYDVSNWYVSTHPQSHFLHELVAARPASDRRYTLRNRNLTIRYMDNRTEKRFLSNVAEIRAVLEREFQIRFPDAEELDRVLQKVTTAERVSASEAGD